MVASLIKMYFVIGKSHTILLYNQATSFSIFQAIMRPYQELSIKTLTATRHHALIVFEEIKPEDGLE
jgi:hypothetical protein